LRRGRTHDRENEEGLGSETQTALICQNLKKRLGGATRSRGKKNGQRRRKNKKRLKKDKINEGEKAKTRRKEKNGSETRTTSSRKD